jgi:predicted DNA binding CopG/RHH family protein
MNQIAKIPASDEAWDSGELGKDKTHAKKVRIPAEHRARQDEGLDLQLISIRMPKSLIEDLKKIASLNNMGYQPLARQALTRFVTGELKRIARDRIDELHGSMVRRAKADADATAAVVKRKRAA